MIMQLAFLKDFDYSVNFVLALVYFDKNDYASCIICLKTFMTLSGIGKLQLFDVALYLLGASYLKINDYENARKYLIKCIEKYNEYKNDVLYLLGLKKN